MNCLLISPKSFYFYSQYLKNTLEEEGYTVTLSNDEYPENVMGKIMGKLKIPLLLSITKKKIESRYLNEGQKYDKTIIIKGRGLSKGLVRSLKENSKVVIAYTFDSIKYHDAPLGWYKSVNKFYTFDYRDAEKYQIPVIELFSSMPENRKEKELKYDISAIVRNHSERLSFIDEILKKLSPNSKFIFIYEQNMFTFLQNFSKSPLLYIKYWKYISFKPLAYPEYIRVLQESSFTIDYAHPYQSGITIRCFEALAAQTKIITNNSYVYKYKHFDEKNAIIFDSKNLGEQVLNNYNKMKNFIPPVFTRNIKHFIKDILKSNTY